MACCSYIKYQWRWLGQPGYKWAGKVFNREERFRNRIATWSERGRERNENDPRVSGVNFWKILL